MKTALLILGFGLIFCTAASAQPPEVEGKQAQLGHAYYVELCANCHGAEGKGDGPSSREYSGVALDLTRIAERRGGVFDERSVRDLIESHQPTTVQGWGEILRPALEEQGRRSIARHRIALIAKHLEALQRR